MNYFPAAYRDIASRERHRAYWRRPDARSEPASLDETAAGHVNRVSKPTVVMRATFGKRVAGTCKWRIKGRRLHRTPTSFALSVNAYEQQATDTRHIWTRRTTLSVPFGQL
jgi:hypothetical protein